MERRLYFLFPDTVHARHAIDNLLDGTGVDARHIHAVARNETDLERLPATTRRQKMDYAGRIERRLWNANLGMFGFGLIGLIVALFRRTPAGAFGAAALMAVTFIAGFVFTQRVPDTRIDRFRDALAHGEVLVMIDVPNDKVFQVEEFMHHRYPEAVPGGASWHVEALGM